MSGSNVAHLSAAEEPEVWGIHDLEAERTVLGASILSPPAFIEAQSVVDGDDLWHPAHRAIWAAVGGMTRDHVPVDALTLWERVEREQTSDRLRALGGMGYLTDLQAQVLSFETIGYHASKVAKLAERRRWAMELRRLTALAYDPREPSDAFFGNGEASMLGLMHQRKTTSSLVGAKQAMKGLIGELTDRFEARNSTEPKGVMLGFSGFDAASSGLRPGQLAILAARPSMGKSAFMGNVVENVARAGMPCLVFTLEMTATEIFERMLASGGIHADRLRTGHLTQSDFLSMNRTASDIGTGNRIWLDESGTLTIDELGSRARRWRAREGAGKHALVCVDYLQLVSVRGRGKNTTRENEVAEVSRGLKALAKDLKCPVLALAQLNRELEKRGNKRPGLGDLRESGQIEQDADVVLFIHREEVANPTTCKPEDKGIAELILAKGRGMQVGMTRLAFDGPHVSFRNLSTRSA
jgi:replicative DNA helicase